MLSMRAVCVVVLALALACQGVSAIIFRDFTSGATFSLTHSLTAPGDADSAYHTGCSGHFKFAVYWNGDVQDAFTIAPPAGVSIAAQKDDAFCGKEVGATVTFTSRTPNHCNYTASWTRPVSGVLGITYNTGDSPSFASQEISIPFDTSSQNCA